jgi:hypothetical protein
MDRALRGNRLTKKPKTQQPNPSMTRRPREEEMTGNELLGVYATGGWKGKPHSTKEGRIASGERKITRFYDQYKKKKKGTPV